MFSRFIETLSIIFVEILRKHPYVRFATLMTVVVASGALTALVYGAVSGHTFVGGRQLQLIDTVPFVIPTSIIVFWLLMAVAMSLIEPDRLKDVFNRKSDDDDIISSIADSVLSPLGAAIRIVGGDANLIVTRVQKAGQPEGKEIAAEEDIIQGIRGNLGQLIEYYKMNKAQARNSFSASLWSIIAGFITIVVGGIWAYSANRNDLTAYLVPFAGIILQFIGGGYFYLYNRSLIQLNFFFSRLAQMQDTLLAIHLAETMGDGDAKNKALEKLIFVIAERSTIAPAYLGEEYTKRKAKSA
jgi:hypothetical protein